MKKAEGGYFVVRAVDPGRSCEDDTDEQKNVIYLANITGSNNYQLNYEANYSNTTITYDYYGEVAVKVGEIPDMEYGKYRWSATAINTGHENANSTSDSIEFCVCDSPTPIELNGPETDVNTSNEIVFRWSKIYKYGHRCDCDPTIVTEVVLIIERTDTDELVASKLMGALAESWDVSSVLADYHYRNVTFRWYMLISNGYENVSSEVRTFTLSNNTCALQQCESGSCKIDNYGFVYCACSEGYYGERCELGNGKEKNVGLIVGSVLGSFFGAVIIIGIIVFFVLRKRKSEQRKRVLLKGPTGDLRFSTVKTSSQDVALSAAETESLRQRLNDDATNGGFALSMAIIGSTSSIENTCKALLYAHHHDHNDVAFVKALIGKEVLSSVQADVIFRANTAATLSFKHLSKMVGLNYLFTTLGSVLRDVIQKDADDAAVEERMKKDKNLSELMVMQDTCEVDPSMLADSCGQDDMLSINAIQLTLLVQRFVKQILQSAKNIPTEIREVMIEISNTVGLMYPDAVQCALSAFLFLRFYNCGIAVPESYGLLEETPNERVRRTLVLATKILTTMSSGARFGDKEEFMIQFNDIIDKNQKDLVAFYSSVCSEEAINRSDHSEEFVDTPPKVYANSMSVISTCEKKVSSGESA